MSLALRLICVAGLLAAGIVVNILLSAHINKGSEEAFPELRRPLAELPERLEGAGSGESAAPAWAGQEHPGRAAVAKQVPFADEMLYRVYQSAGGQSALLYAAYSRQGEDRKHHPEICMREAAGAPEDLLARAEIPLDADGERLAQRFRFRVETGRHLHLYYWHYTFSPSGPVPHETMLRHLHRRLIASPPSISVQVTTYAAGADLEVVERSLLPAVDAALRENLLPEGTLVGHDRIPITLLRR